MKLQTEAWEPGCTTVWTAVINPLSVTTDWPRVLCVIIDLRSVLYHRHTQSGDWISGLNCWVINRLRNFCCIWSSSVMLNGAIGLYFCVFDRGSFHVFHEYNGFWTLLWWLRVWRDISVLHHRYGMWKIKGNLFVIMYGAELALVCFPHSHLSHERGADSLHGDNPESVTGQQPAALRVLLLGGEGGFGLQHHFHRWTLSDQQTVWWAGDLWWWVDFA